MSWIWITAWFEQLSTPWLVLAAREPGAKNYSAFLPLQIATSGSPEGEFHNELYVGGIYFAPLAGLLCKAGSEAPVFKAFADKLKTLHWRVLRLDTVASASRLERFLAHFGQDTFKQARSFVHVPGDATDYSIYPFLHLPSDFESYLEKSLGSRTRRNARAALRKLESGEYRVTQSTAETFERDLDVLMRLWVTKWEPAKGKTSAAIEIDQHRTMLRACFDAGQAILPVLWHGDTPVAAQGRLIDRRASTVHCLVNARDLGVHHPSPSFLLHLDTIRWAIGNGFAIYDFQQGNHRTNMILGPRNAKSQVLGFRPSTGATFTAKLESRSFPFVVGVIKDFLATGKVAEARRAVEQVLETDPTNADALELRRAIRAAQGKPTLKAGQELHRKGDARGAENIYREILESDPYHFDATHLLGVLLLDRGDVADAETVDTPGARLRTGVRAGTQQSRHRSRAPWKTGRGA